MDRNEGRTPVDAGFLARVAPAAASREANLDLAEVSSAMSMSSSRNELQSATHGEVSAPASPPPARRRFGLRRSK